MIPLPPGKLDRYVGTYVLADLTRTIRPDGDHLSIANADGAFKPLLAETSEVFFVPGQPRIRLIFEFDDGGRVIQCIERR